MTTKNRNILIAIILLAVFAMIASLTMGHSHLVIGGEEIDDIGGVTGFVIAMGCVFFGIFVALSVTGFVLAVLGLVLVVVLGAVLGSVAIAMLPLLIPFLILYALISLFRTKKTS
ncbi:MAG: hypothetical protein HY253_13140 [Burkholderiales bacterium]|nr:hypothetical protein [Burkholderiales bacterium]